MFATIFKDFYSSNKNMIWKVLLYFLIAVFIFIFVDSVINGRKKLKDTIKDQEQVIEVISNIHQEEMEKNRKDREAREKAAQEAILHQQNQEAIAKEFDKIGLDLQAELDQILLDSLMREPEAQAPVAQAQKATPAKRVAPKPARVTLKPKPALDTGAQEVQRQQRVATAVSSAIEQAYLKASKV